MNSIVSSENEPECPLRDLDALDLVVRLPQLLKPPPTKDIVSFSFKTYKPTPPVEERIRISADSAALRVLHEAAKLRDQWPDVVGASLPFWESVSVAAALERDHKSLLKEAVTHIASGRR